MSRPETTTARPRTGITLGKRIADAAREVAAHLRGEISLATYQVAVPDTIDIAGFARVRPATVINRRKARRP